MQADFEALETTVGTMQGDLEALETTILNEITRATNDELLIIDSISTSTRTYISGEIIKTNVIYKSNLTLLIII